MLIITSFFNFVTYAWKFLAILIVQQKHKYFSINSIYVWDTKSFENHVHTYTLCKGSSILLVESSTQEEVKFFRKLI